MEAALFLSSLKEAIQNQNKRRLERLLEDPSFLLLTGKELENCLAVVTPVLYDVSFVEKFFILFYVV